MDDEDNDVPANVLDFAGVSSVNKRCALGALCEFADIVGEARLGREFKYEPKAGREWFCSPDCEEKAPVRGPPASSIPTPFTKKRARYYVKKFVSRLSRLVTPGSRR